VAFKDRLDFRGLSRDGDGLGGERGDQLINE
jgi:hypothetical protein